MKKKKDNSSKVIVLIALAIAFYLVYTFHTQEIQLNKLEQEIIELEKEKKEKEQMIKEIKDEIQNINSPQYIEKYAREELKMVRENEKVYVDVNKSGDR